MTAVFFRTSLKMNTCFINKLLNLYMQLLNGFCNNSEKCCLYFYKLCRSNSWYLYLWACFGWAVPEQICFWSLRWLEFVYILQCIKCFLKQTIWSWPIFMLSATNLLLHRVPKYCVFRAKPLPIDYIKLFFPSEWNFELKASESEPRPLISTDGTFMKLRRQVKHSWKQSL